MIRRFVGAFCLAIAISGFLAAAAQQGVDAVGSAVLSAIFCVVGLVLFFKKGKSKEEKAAQKAQLQEEKERNSRMLVAEHMSGLPLAQLAACTVFFEEACITIHSSGNTFNLSYDKITAMDLKTSAEIQRAYVSSAGGAIVGGALLGPLGAMVGGRVKEKTSKIVENFIIFTYLKDGNIDYLSFKVQAAHKAMKLIQQYKPRISQQGAVTEL